ncbi:hypothetical protein GCM10007907_11950 [Chitinimonas prasina]|uniref:DUF4402 domain-containing protein n=2 Tax=Chitinimonas prasina TaxID=1434937 RepID=A0ABQ5YBT7_9NEIS|nr:hypothetical protein GCM10007907_11950 [Chitinimonas prasina]
MNPSRYARRLIPAIFPALLILGAHTMASAQNLPILINIDEGTVEVELTDAPMSEPYRLSYGPQGHCQPEVAITAAADGVAARHTRSCHGQGRDEGTIFTLTLSTHASHTLQLKAGRINLRGQPGVAAFGSFDSEVKVGRINNRRSDLSMQVGRRFLVGATAQHQQDGLGGQLKVSISYGELNIL